METRLSGFRVEGPWENVVSHGDAISQSLRALGASAHPRMKHEEYRQAVREWEEWRPRIAETLEEDVRPRTAKKASLVEGEGERRGRPPVEDLGNAGSALLAPSDYARVDASILARIVEASRLTTRAFDTSIRKAFRFVEESIYQNLMTRMAPCYFDNRVLSANIEQCTPRKDAYRFEVNINNDRLKEEVAKQLEKDEPHDAPAW